MSTKHKAFLPGGMIFAIMLLVTSGLGYAATNYYVWKDNPLPQPPFTNWFMAATNIQDAVNLTIANDIVYVTNGTYDTGGTAVSVLTNRVYVSKAISLRSANNDPTNTIIKGRFDTGEPGAPGTITNGPAAVRCVYMVAGSSLIGFTLTNGATTATAGNDGRGGGVWCADLTPIISNCVITGNSAHGYGGGAWEGNLYNCAFIGNSAVTYDGGGVYYAGTISNCTFVGNSAGRYGGGAYLTTLYNCMLVSNSAVERGGGTDGSDGACKLYNCMLAGNSAPTGGGSRKDILYNCTVVGNSATGSGGGTWGSSLYNCIVYFNTAPSGSNWTDASSSFTNCCTTPLPSDGNITNDPMFVNTNAGNYRLNANSPCVNTGTNGSWTTSSVDLDGKMRIRYGRVDIGAYETIYKGTVFSFH